MGDTATVAAEPTAETSTRKSALIAALEAAAGDTKIDFSQFSEEELTQALNDAYDSLEDTFNPQTHFRISILEVGVSTLTQKLTLGREILATLLLPMGAPVPSKGEETIITLSSGTVIDGSVMMAVYTYGNAGIEVLLYIMRAETTRNLAATVATRSSAGIVTAKR